MVRLDKAVALTGMTRTEARKAIAAGRVQVNGQAARDQGMQVEPRVVTATEDRALPTVSDLLPESVRRRGPGPVGRLDRDVTGLVLMTTNGQLAHRLISPKWKAEKVYRARCEGELTEADVEAFASGMALSDFVALPAKLEILSAGGGESLADVVLTEGKFHQVKRMFAAVGHPLIGLKRLRIGPIALDESLAPGEWRMLTAEEAAALLAQCSL